MASRSPTPTLMGSGTAPPTVTMSESGFLGVPIVVQITTLGILGVAVFTYQIGAQAAVLGVLAAASVALGSTGVTLQFSAGTYAADNVYRGFV